MKLFAIRYFVVKSSLTLFPLDEGMEPQDLFTYPLTKGLETSYYNRTYTTRFLNRNLDDRYLVGYLLKSTDTHLIKLDKELFNEEDIQNWEKLFFVIDTKNQVIAIEHQNQTATPENVKNVLHKLTNKSASNSGYEVKLDFLVDKFAFWEIIKESQGIYQIAFDLNAPNLFGGSKKANSWLKNLKERHNMTKVAVDFRNENAELGYEEEELESYRDYADSGGGHWTLGVLENGRKKKYKSASHLRREEIELDTNDPNFLRQNLQYIVERLQTVIAKLDDFKDE
jgi:hypothetical protein